MARICDFPDCGRGNYAFGLCQGHNAQRTKGKALTPLRHYTVVKPPPESCLIGSCEKPREGRQELCAGHYFIARSYNLQPDDYSAMYLLGCGLCGKTTGALAVDHDHSCCPDRKRSCGACVRGLLCSDCNFLMGWIDKLTRLMPNLLARIAAYQRAYSRTETTRV